MNYLLIIAHDDGFAPTERLVAEIMDWIKSMEARGIRVQGNPLRPASEAVTVRVRDGRISPSAGPFSRSREQMCAYELIQCASLDIAVEVAAKHPMAAVATIEVRPVWSQLSEG
ncbi:YciI family protein [Pelomonas sp. Root1237]|uniref:YciI family protein n=1 Tax=Pelomonas sp. Root1237 TaxID=1736434 RepID=UPI0006FC0D7A|nr:YciI family protein [Pelomonas sp. Root1237]KQV88957.1 transcription initiation protein [Pelomonas sp. Root1237]